MSVNNVGWRGLKFMPVYVFNRESRKSSYIVKLSGISVIMLPA